MAGKKLLICVALCWPWLWLVAGCADPGVLYQKQHADGRVDRLRLDGAEGWSEYDTTPRYRSHEAQGPGWLWYHDEKRGDFLIKPPRPHYPLNPLIIRQGLQAFHKPRFA